MGHRLLWRFGSVTCAVWLALGFARATLAVHESTNVLEFAPVPGQAASSGSGRGTIDYRGGDAAGSRWTATFRFEGLNPGAPYVVAVRGRFGEDGSPEAAELTGICAFTADSTGAGGCWYYFVVLVRLGVVQLQEGELDGPAVLQATRADGPGTILSEPNRFSPVDPSPPVATPGATPLATPGSG